MAGQPNKRRHEFTMTPAVKPITPTPFTDWCADRRNDADNLALDGLPADQYFATLDAGHELLDALHAALSRKVPVTMGGR